MCDRLESSVNLENSADHVVLTNLNHSLLLTDLRKCDLGVFDVFTGM